MRPENSEFELRGINHLALVCRDMQRTVDFYSGVLGMPLIKTIELPRNYGPQGAAWPLGPRLLPKPEPPRKVTLA